MFNAAIERGTGVRRLHITEEAQMKENVCVDCKYYESCGKPERYIKCMGYEEKERQQAAGENAVDVQDGQKPGKTGKNKEWRKSKWRRQWKKAGLLNCWNITKT